MDIRGALAGLAALITAVALGATQILSRLTPSALDSEQMTAWYELHASVLGWRAVAMAVAAVGVVAFAASFRERTWATVPERLWTGTLMVLASLGFAALVSMAAAVDVALFGVVQASTDASADLIAFGTHFQRALRIVATPALIVVLLGAALPLSRWTRAGTVAALGSIAVSLALCVPYTWRFGFDAAPVWFVLAGAVMTWATPKAPTPVHIVDMESHTGP